MERFITIKQFCELNSCSRSTAYREVKAGRLPLRKMGRASRIAVSDATIWQEQLEASGRSQPSH
jgi:excisionase family DNA binding protein